jgi:mycothiol system anti-sigma-R factor
MMNNDSHGPARKCGDLTIEQCREAIARLDEYLDRELTPEDRARLEKHLRVCDPCSEDYDLRSKAQAILRLKLCGEKCPDELKALISDLLREADTPAR